MTTKLFERVNKRSKKWGESNDCTVKALAIATGISYEQAHGLLALRGRSYRKGTDMSSVWSAMKEIGWKATTVVDRKKIEFHDKWIDKDYGFKIKQSVQDTLKKMKKHRLYPAKTIKTLPDYLPSRGIFLVETSAHVLCVRAGQIHDWTKNRRHRITEIHQISRIKEVTTQPKAL